TPRSGSFNPGMSSWPRQCKPDCNFVGSPGARTRIVARSGNGSTSGGSAVQLQGDDPIASFALAPGLLLGSEPLVERGSRLARRPTGTRRPRPARFSLAVREAYLVSPSRQPSHGVSQRSPGREPCYFSCRGIC